MPGRVDRSVLGSISSGRNWRLEGRSRATQIEELVTTRATSCQADRNQRLVDRRIDHDAAVHTATAGKPLTGRRATGQGALQRRTGNDVDVGVIGDADRLAGS